MYNNIHLNMCISLLEIKLLKQMSSLFLLPIAIIKKNNFFILPGCCTDVFKLSVILYFFFRQKLNKIMLIINRLFSSDEKLRRINCLNLIVNN